MSKPANIIRAGAVVDDDWVLLAADTHVATATPPMGKLIVSLDSWLAWRDVLVGHRQHLGVWLDSHQDPAELAGAVDGFSVIAVNFPKFTDGRGYSIAALLRSRYGFKGELRAIGDVLRDQLFYMQRVGFDAFALRADSDIHAALSSLNDFSESYQGSIAQPVPLFRRGRADLAAALPSTARPKEALVP